MKQTQFLNMSTHIYIPIWQRHLVYTYMNFHNSPAFRLLSNWKNWAARQFIMKLWREKWDGWVLCCLSSCILNIISQCIIIISTFFTKFNPIHSSSSLFSHPKAAIFGQNQKKCQVGFSLVASRPSIFVQSNHIKKVATTQNVKLNTLLSISHYIAP